MFAGGEASPLGAVADLPGARWSWPPTPERSTPAGAGGGSTSWSATSTPSRPRHPGGAGGGQRPRRPPPSGRQGPHRPGPRPRRGGRGRRHRPHRRRRPRRSTRPPARQRGCCWPPRSTPPTGWRPGSGPARLTVLRGGRRAGPSRRADLALLPVGGPAGGVTTEGLGTTHCTTPSCAPGSPGGSATA